MSTPRNKQNYGSTSFLGSDYWRQHDPAAYALEHRHVEKRGDYWTIHDDLTGCDIIGRYSTEPEARRALDKHIARIRAGG